MNATTLTKFKAFINRTDTDCDTFITNEIPAITRAIETYLRMPLQLTQYTEVLSGDGTDSTILDNWNSKDLVSVSFDDVAQTLTDFTIENGGCVIYDESTFPKGHRNLSIVHKAGFEQIRIITGVNDSINFKYKNVDYSATVDAGIYSLKDLATEITTKMNAELTDDSPITVSYEYNTNLFTFTSNMGYALFLSGVDVSSAINFELYFASADVASGSIHPYLGFPSTNQTANVTYSGTTEILGIEEDITLAANSMLQRIWNDQEKKLFDLKKKEISKGGTTEYNMNDFPRTIQLILDRYKRPMSC